ncbi:hypothetical protein Tco_1179447 [Tanacetum coccineum]
MVTVPIYQASSSVPPMSTPIIDLSPSKPAPSTTQAPIFTATTSTTTTTRPLPPPPQQQSTKDSELYARVTALEDLPHKIDEAVRENVKEAVQTALQAPHRERFRDLPEANMKEMLHQRMFEIGSYKSLPEHIALYEALESSMEQAQRDELLAEKDKSCKRLRDDQDPLPPPPDSDLSKRRRHDTSAFGSSQPQAPQSSKQQSGPHAEQPVEDIPIPYSAHISDSEDTDFSYLLKINKGSGQALSISKMKATRYLEFGLKLLVLEHMWINEICTYDISASYGISYWWFNHQKFYIDRHIADSSRKKQLNLTKPGWDAKGFEYKHDYTIIESPRAVVFPVGNNERKIMRFNEIYKFSDSTLTNIMEALDYKVKEYKVNQLNPGMNTRFWTDKDVARRKEFIHFIERRLKTRRIFQNLECFVGGRVRDIDYRLL